MPVAVPKKKRSLLPLLTILFLFSYALMTLLIIQQGSVIQSQRNLIKVLMRDSTELWSAKGKAIGDRQAAKMQGQSGAQAPAANTPATQAPSTQAPSNQAPSKDAPQSHSPSHADKIAKPGPQLPPAPASDLVDRRRALTTI